MQLTQSLYLYKCISKLQCLMCSHRCHHVKLLSDWCRQNDIHLDSKDPLVEEQTFKSVSYTSIPHPLPVHLWQLLDKHRRGVLEFPVHLTPKHRASLKCEHGHAFNLSDPVQSGWISKTGITIYKAATTIVDENRAIHYRQSLGPCSCKQLYDGQEDPLFNLDGKHLFY